MEVICTKFEKKIFIIARDGRLQRAPEAHAQFLVRAGRFHHEVLGSIPE